MLTLFVVYGVLVAAGVGWLSWRGRMPVIAACAVGRHGPLVAVLAGTATGLAFHALSRLLARYLRPFGELDAKLAGVIGPVDTNDALLIAMVSGAAEEFFFRCAMQDALGPWLTALLFALAHLAGRSMALWSVQALVFGLAMGGLVNYGCGVLAAALAHAIFNYLWFLGSMPR